MRQKNYNYKMNYTVIEHAIEMFKSNSRYLAKMEKEFDILPYSERYYRDNNVCFTHKDKLEINMFITELINLGYIEKHSNPFNIVVLTELGKDFLNNHNKHLDSIYRL